MKKLILSTSILCYVMLVSCTAQQSMVKSEGGDLHQMITTKAAQIEQEVIALRRHYHENPELSNREFETSKHIAAELRKLGLPVDEGMAHTGVIAVLDSGKPGPTIGLRADIDGLPVTERADLPFKSVKKTTYLGNDVGVMHACGHDTHIAMLLGSAKILTSMKDQLTGKIVFVFQPAEEGAPPGEEGGAKLMVKEGIFEKYGIDVFFGQHISSGIPAGHLTYKIGGTMAAADRFVIKVKGKQTHGSRPWGGVDPITAAAQIIQGLNNIVSRQTELTKEAAVISVGVINGGVRNNIIPEEVELIGTIRTLDKEMQKIIHEKIKLTATSIAQSSGAVAEVDIQIGYPVTFNDIELTKQMVPTLMRVAGEANVHNVPAVTGAEDFSFFANTVPSLYFFTGGKGTGKEAFPHHTPDFYIEESGMLVGMKAITNLAVDYMISAGK